MRDAQLKSTADLAVVVWSFIALVFFEFVAVFSFGLLGMLIYFAIHPIFSLFYTSLYDLHYMVGWPVFYYAGTVWPLSFLAAAALGLALNRCGSGRWVRVGAYLFVLWAGAVLTFVVVLNSFLSD